MVKTVAPKAGGGGLIPSQGTEILHAMQCVAKIKKKKFFIKKKRRNSCQSQVAYTFFLHIFQDLPFHRS